VCSLHRAFASSQQSRAAVGCFLIARFLGPTTIRDTFWAMLNIQTPALENEAGPPRGRSSVEPAE